MGPGKKKNGLTAVSLVALASIPDGLGQEEALGKAINSLRDKQTPPPILEAKRRLFTEKSPGEENQLALNDKIVILAIELAQHIHNWLHNPKFCSNELEKKVNGIIQNSDFEEMDRTEAEKFAYHFVLALTQKIHPVGLGIPSEHFQRRVIWLLENQKADGQWESSDEKTTIACTAVYLMLAAIMQNPPPAVIEQD